MTCKTLISEHTDTHKINLRNNETILHYRVQQCMPFFSGVGSRIIFPSYFFFSMIIPKFRPMTCMHLIFTFAHHLGFFEIADHSVTMVKVEDLLEVELFYSAHRKQQQSVLHLWKWSVLSVELWGNTRALVSERHVWYCWLLINNWFRKKYKISYLIYLF